MYMMEKDKGNYTYPVCVVIQDNKVSVADIKSRQVVAGVFSIKYVFIHNIGSSSGFWCVSTEGDNIFIKTGFT